MEKKKNVILLVLCNLFWSGNYISGNLVAAEISPLWLTICRWAFSLCLLAPLACIIEKPNWRALIKHWRAIIILSLSGIAGYNIVLYSALKYTTAINASLINTFSPALVALFSLLVLHERLTRTQICGIVISLMGVLVVLTKGSTEVLLSASFNKGDLFMLLALSIWVFYTIMIKKNSIPALTLTTAIAAFSVLILFPLGLYEGMDFTRLSSQTIWIILYIVIFPSVCSFIFWSIGVRNLGAAKAGVFLNLIPVFTAIISVSLGGELSWAQIIGGTLVFLGVYFTAGV